MAMSNKVYLVRHGETQWSKLGRHTGRTDIPLLETGRAGARTLAPRLSRITFAAVFVSPLVRARETCELAGFGDRAVVDERLAEWDYGNVEGRTTDEMQVDQAGWTIWNEGPIGGESLNDVAMRADEMIGRVRGINGDVALFAHGHLLRILASRWIASDPHFARNLALGPASISTLSTERTTPVISTWNT